MQVCFQAFKQPTTDLSFNLIPGGGHSAYKHAGSVQEIFRQTKYITPASLQPKTSAHFVLST